jgi:hypothetical protein
MEPDSRVFHPAPEDTTGYAIAPVPSGPNSGYWYVLWARHKMDLVSRVNPYAWPDSPALFPAPGCMMDPANAYDYNVCKGIDFARFLYVVGTHEDWHGALGLQAAAVMNPREQIEGRYADSDTKLRELVTFELIGVRNYIGDKIKVPDRRPCAEPNWWYGYVHYNKNQNWQKGEYFYICLP